MGTDIGAIYLGPGGATVVYHHPIGSTIYMPILSVCSFTHCPLIVTHFAGLPLIYEDMPPILMVFTPHFHSQSHRLRGCEVH